MQIKTSGRTDVEEYFKQVVLAYGKLNHTPLLAFVSNGEKVEVRVIIKPRQTLDLPDDTPMMGQWEGEWRSDFFQFTAGMLKKFVMENPSQVYYPKEWRMPERGL